MKQYFIIAFVLWLISFCLAGAYAAESTCYELGYKFGMYATKATNGIPCKPENDIVIPKRCRNKAETGRGIRAGTEAVYDVLNLDKGGSR